MNGSGAPQVSYSVAGPGSGNVVWQPAHDWQRNYWDKQLNRRGRREQKNADLADHDIHTILVGYLDPKGAAVVDIWRPDVFYKATTQHAAIFEAQNEGAWRAVVATRRSQAARQHIAPSPAPPPPVPPAPIGLVNWLPAHTEGRWSYYTCKQTNVAKLCASLEDKGLFIVAVYPNEAPGAIDVLVRA